MVMRVPSDGDNFDHGDNGDQCGCTEGDNDFKCLPRFSLSELECLLFLCGEALRVVGDK